MARPSILVTARIPSSVLARLREVGDVDAVTGDGTLSRDEFLRRLAGKDGALCVMGNRLDGEAFDTGLPTLKIAANIAVGYDNVDLAAARARGVIVTNTPDVLTDAVADLTIGMMLAVTRRLVEGDRLVRANGWKGWALDFMLGAEVRGHLLGIVGFGRIGRAVADRARAFGMRIAYAVPPDGETVEAAGDATPMTPDRLLASADVVSVHVPLNDRTRHLIGQRELARMKRSAYLLNTSRGPVVDEAALAWALREHLIAGAALDVFEREPEVHPELLGLEGVVLVPHLGSATVETRTAMADLAARNVIEVLSGRPPLTPLW